jgi:hypothetical protein
VWASGRLPELAMRGQIALQGPAAKQCGVLMTEKNVAENKRFNWIKIRLSAC